jgi:hypothetical protein
METFGRRILPLAVVGALGATAACDDAPKPADAPVARDPGAAKVETGATGCTMNAEPVDNGYRGFASVNGTVPSGSKLIIHATYSGAHKFKTPDQTIAAEGSATFPPTHEGKRIWAITGTILGGGKKTHKTVCATKIF